MFSYQLSILHFYWNITVHGSESRSSRFNKRRPSYHAVGGCRSARDQPGKLHSSSAFISSFLTLVLSASHSHCPLYPLLTPPPESPPGKQQGGVTCAGKKSLYKIITSFSNGILLNVSLFFITLNSILMNL